MNKRRGKRVKKKAPPLGSEHRMPFAPMGGFIKGFIPSGPVDQGFEGWQIHAHKPTFPATPVVVMTRDDYESLLIRAAAGA